MTTQALDVGVTTARRARPARATLHPNLMSIPFGLAGLTGCWSAARPLLGVPGWVVATLWTLTIAVFLVVLVPYVVQVVSDRRVAAELADARFGPFLVLPGVLVMILAAAVASHDQTVARVVFGLGLGATVMVGVLLSGQWLRGDVPLEQWHPGYLLPTVAGGFVAAIGAVAVGLPRIAQLMFGYGFVCWLVLSSIILARMVAAPALPLPLRPTLVIEVAPPAVAGTAWFAMNGGRADLVAMMLLGFALLMALVQVRLVRYFAVVPFGPGTWAFSFAYSQVFALLVRWLTVDPVPGRQAMAWAALVVVTAGILALAARTVTALAAGTFLPRAEARFFVDATTAPPATS